MKSLYICVAVTLLTVVSTTVAQSVAQMNQMMWQKYRHELNHYLARNFCQAHGKGYPCVELDRTVFQFLDEPHDATWHTDKYYLNEGICKFVPAWQTSFKPRCAGHDCTIPKVYENLVKQFPNVQEGAQEFLRFSKSPTESFAKRGISKSYPWVERGATLQQFVNQMAGRTYYGFSFTIDKNTPTGANTNPWGLKVPNWAGEKSFIRRVDNKGQTVMSDFLFATKEEKPIESPETELADFLFRRRRRRPPPRPVPVPPQIIKSNTFRISFFAKDVRAINIAPSSWFNLNLLRRYGGQLTRWWGPNGALSLIPRSVYVAHQPKVEIVIAESQLGALQNELNKGSAFAWLIGGVQFKQHRTAPLSDSDDSASTDRIYIEEMPDQPPQETPLSKPAEAMKKRFDLLRGNQEFEDMADEYSMHPEAKIQSDFLFRRRRRRRRPPPPPPPPPPKRERDFKITFESRSPTPQIIGVVSDIMP